MMITLWHQLIGPTASITKIQFLNMSCFNVSSEKGAKGVYFVNFLTIINNVAIPYYITIARTITLYRDV